MSVVKDTGYSIPSSLFCATFLSYPRLSLDLSVLALVTLLLLLLSLLGHSTHSAHLIHFGFLENGSLKRFGVEFDLDPTWETTLLQKGQQHPVQKASVHGLW